MTNEKKIKVVMLATDKPSKLGLVTVDNRLYQFEQAVKHEGQHLYFLSDEKIKEGDWVLHKNIYGNFSPPEKVIKVDGDTIECGIVFGSRAGVTKNGAGFYKIIASNNPELNGKYSIPHPSNTRNQIVTELPRPSNSFMQKFVEEYNKGNIIEEVMVEYGEHRSKQGDFEGYFLKVASDNSITIKPVVENWGDIFDKWRESSEYKMNQSFNGWLMTYYNPPTIKTK